MAEWSEVFYVKPRAKERPRFAGRVTFTPRQTAAAEAELRWLMAKAFKHPPFTGPLAIEVSYFFSRPKSVSEKKRPYPSVKPDSSNLVKLIEDAGNGLLWVDDSQIVRLTAEKLYCAGGTRERIEFTMRQVETPALTKSPAMAG